MLAHIQRRWQEGCRNGTQMWRELQAQGCHLAFRTVSRQVALLRKEYGVRGYGSVTPEDERPTMTILTPRKLARLYLKDPGHLTTQERQHLDEVLAKEDRFRAVYGQVQAFGQMVRTRGGQRLEDWLAEVEQGECVPHKAYALGLRKDFAAVFAGLTLPYSQGVVEGHVHRLKLIKRSGYGKMGFPTLCQRVLIRQAS